jgi:CheY-like chemotaxis protein
MNGLDCTRNLRSLGVTTPIVGLTGNALLEDQSALINAGADCVLTKPIDKLLLLETLKEYKIS